MTSQILQKIEKLEREIKHIKKHMVDEDCILTEDDYKALRAARREKAAGKLISHEQLKKELGL